jgi:lysozyme
MVFRLRWPTEYSRVTQAFGVNPQNYRAFGLPGHEGIDFLAPEDSRVFACADGVVAEVRLDGNTNVLLLPYGNQVRIIHDTPEGQFTTIYAHLKSVSVAAGTAIHAGDELGIADSTGNSTGSHLHLTLKKAGATAAHETTFPRDIIDPTPFLDVPAGVVIPAPAQVHDALRFEADITIPDNSIIPAGQPFNKTWRVTNTGNRAWDNGFSLTFASGDQLGAPARVMLPAAQPGATVDVTVPMIAPEEAGSYGSYWQPCNSDGVLFRQVIFALIQVSSTAEVEILFNGIVDLSHHNTIRDLQASFNDGIVAIIHKATQGTRHVDRRYKERFLQAQGLGIMWAAYHFGVSGDPIGQADHFLNTVQPEMPIPLALDLEGNPRGGSMNLSEAEQFVERIHSQTGKYPILYTNRAIIRAMLPDNAPTTLSNCPLWIATWGEAPSLPPQWNNWNIWQYSNGLAGPEPHAVVGMSRVDRNKFNGTKAQLQAFWGM